MYAAKIPYALAFVAGFFCAMYARTLSPPFGDVK